MNIRINLSEQLIRILEEICDSSKVAELLLIAQIYGVPDDKLVENYIDYLSVSHSDNTKISYLTQDRSKLSLDVWGTSKRIFGRPGSVVKKIFKNLEDREVELFNNLYKSALNKSEFKFDIISGESIRRYYHFETYRGESGSLGNSCMKYDNCQKYLNLYTENPDVINMLIMLDSDGLLLGRALLWKFDSYKIMDRIYTVNDEELPYHFKKWAIDNGYMYKHEQKWNNTLAFELGGKKIQQKLSFQLKNFIHDRYPYLDTFKFFDKQKGILYNYIPHDDVKTISAPDGRYFDSDFFSLDFFTELYQHRGETVSIFYENGKIDRNLQLRTHSNNVEWSRINDMYLLRKDCEYFDDVDDYLFINELEHLNDKSKIEEVKLKIKKQKEQREQRERELIFESPTRTPSMRSFAQVYDGEPIQRQSSNPCVEVPISSGTINLINDMRLSDGPSFSFLLDYPDFDWYTPNQ